MVVGGAHMRKREAHEVIRRKSSSLGHSFIFAHRNHLTICSSFLAESTGCLATNLSSRRFNLTFGVL